MVSNDVGLVEMNEIWKEGREYILGLSTKLVSI